MKQAAAVLCHGGGGTVMSALSHDVPVVCVPFASDQPENSLRVARLGAGFNLPRPGLTPEKVREAVNAVINEKPYREAAARFGRIARSHNGAENAATELERLIGQPRMRAVA
jgi:UDP:flavonoid glycosyltransferase YjiC (YdhE family)